ncbi:hypothetical protein [Rubritalea tangerina]|uniref:hypothetical protein n=1 Tax=Rubritalea tangerina TaxID=430798 RepID=UPI003607FC57
MRSSSLSSLRPEFVPFSSRWKVFVKQRGLFGFVLMGDFSMKSLFVKDLSFRNSISTQNL